MAPVPSVRTPSVPPPSQGHNVAPPNLLWAASRGAAVLGALAVAVSMNRDKLLSPSWHLGHPEAPARQGPPCLGMLQGALTLLSGSPQGHRPPKSPCWGDMTVPHLCPVLPGLFLAGAGSAVQGRAKGHPTRPGPAGCHQWRWRDRRMERTAGPTARPSRSGIRGSHLHTSPGLCQQTPNPRHEGRSACL